MIKKIKSSTILTASQKIYKSISKTTTTTTTIQKTQYNFYTTQIEILRDMKRFDETKIYQRSKKKKVE